MIDEKRLIEELEEKFHDWKMVKKADVYKIIESQPQVERTGEWIDKTLWYGQLGVCRTQCSVCGTIFKGKMGSRGDGKGGKYCEECGSYNGGEKE